ncbi:MAG: DUF6491 family protein [Wenzhouxiangellaceae bacterium]|nr:DUF6491 family protein [Wenzhouxiangellaceae bacterium]
MVAATLPAVAVLAGCAADDIPSPAMDSGRFLQYADEPVKDIRYRNFIEWHPLNREWMLLRFENDRYYVLEVDDPCVADLREVQTLRLVESMTDRLNRLDHVRVDGRDCRIREMRPIDYAAFTQDPAAPGDLPGQGELSGDSFEESGGT